MRSGMWAWTLAGPWMKALVAWQVVFLMGLLGPWRGRRHWILAWGTHGGLMATLLLLLAMGLQGAASSPLFRWTLLGVGVGLMLRVIHRFEPEGDPLVKAQAFSVLTLVVGIWKGLLPITPLEVWGGVLLMAVLWSTVASLADGVVALRWQRVAFLLLGIWLVRQAWDGDGLSGLPKTTWPLAGAWLLQAAALHCHHGLKARAPMARRLAGLALLLVYALAD